MTIIKIHNIETSEIIEREMNAEELAQWEADKAIAAAKAAAKAEAEAKRQALLDKLGITADEARLLLGGN
jgi:hypothetical protein